MITGLLFDKDGTLFDFQLSWSAWAKGFLEELAEGDERRARDLADSIRFDWQAGEFLPDSVAIAGTNHEIAEALAGPLGGVPVADLAHRITLSTMHAPMQPVLELAPFLSGLREQGLALGVATNDAEQAARSQLQVSGILNHFDYVIGFDSGHGAKPDPGPCLSFPKALGLEAHQVAMVGDSLHDLQAGRAAGMRTVGVLTGMAPAEELAPYADVVLPNIGGIPEWLIGLEKAR